jgi:hypothetical protein
MFGCDYPHFESIVPNTKSAVAELLAAVDEADARKVLYRNATTVYGFDLDALQPDIDRIGFTFADATATESAIHKSAAFDFTPPVTRPIVPPAVGSAGRAARRTR